MLEELKILQEIVGDLSGVGLSIVIAYATLRVLIIVAWCWFSWFAISKVYNFFICPVSKEEHKMCEAGRVEALSEVERLKKSRDIDIREAVSTKDEEISKYKRETESVKHMYKILKESKGGE